MKNTLLGNNYGINVEYKNIYIESCCFLVDVFFFFFFFFKFFLFLIIILIFLFFFYNIFLLFKKNIKGDR